MKLQCLIEQYISFRQSLGSTFRSSAAVLRAFGRSRDARAKVANVRPQHVSTFLGKNRLAAKTWFGYFFDLKLFFQYAVSRGYITVAPLPTILPKKPPQFVPYIYAIEELCRLLKVVGASRRKSILEPATIQAMILTYYGAALRLHEAINLTCADVDLGQSLLTIRDTKFGKTRLVPIGTQLTQVLVQYDRTRPKHRQTDAPFFATSAGNFVNCVTLQQNFRILCNLAGIRRTDTRQQPRIHDLRHTFAVHRLTSWYQQGANVQRLLHHLSVYLGHANLQSTQVYLSMTPELLREASNRFEHYAGKEQYHA